jgi:hypothetical protein
MPLFTLLDKEEINVKIALETKHMSWKKLIECTLPKLNDVCLVIRYLKHYSTVETLKMLYHAYLHSAIMYGIIFGETQ